MTLPSYGSNCITFADEEMTLLVDVLTSIFISDATTTFFPLNLLVSYYFSGRMADIFLEKFIGEGNLYKEKCRTVLEGSDIEQYVIGVHEGTKIKAFNVGTEIKFVEAKYSDDLDENCKIFPGPDRFCLDETLLNNFVFL